MAYVRFGSKVEGDSPRSVEEALQATVNAGVVVPITEPGITADETVSKTDKRKARRPKRKKHPGVTDSLPNAFRKGRKLYPTEIEYVRDIFGPSVRYDKVRITRDHWFSYGSTRVTGNTINFTSFYGGEAIFEDTPEEHLTEAGLDLLGHELMHTWQYQNGGIAYAGDAVTKQAAGFYATGSRNTAYDWQTALEWEIPWDRWGPEQQAEAIDQWNLARRGVSSWSDAAKQGGQELIDKVAPFVEKVRRGEGAVKYSIPGIVLLSFIFGGVGYILKKRCGATWGVILGVLANLPWNYWYLEKPGLTE